MARCGFTFTRIGRLSARSLGSDALPDVDPPLPSEVPVGTPAGLPAIGEVGASFGPAPTWIPAGSVLSRPEPVPPPLPLPWPTACESPAMSGVPGAPDFPAGVAAKVPRRLPAMSAGGGPTAGCKLRAMSWRPDADEVPATDVPTDGDGGTGDDRALFVTPRRDPGIPCTDGDGGTAAATLLTFGPEPRLAIPDPDCKDGGGGTMLVSLANDVTPPRVRRSRTGNRGAGATTSARAMLISPMLRISRCTVGGGATTAVETTGTERVPVDDNEGAGATT